MERKKKYIVYPLHERNPGTSLPRSKKQKMMKNEPLSLSRFYVEGLVQYFKMDEGVSGYVEGETNETKVDVK